jgi:NCAIR mutase (PurE)-related protein
MEGELVRKVHAVYSLPSERFPLNADTLQALLRSVHEQTTTPDEAFRALQSGSGQRGAAQHDADQPDTSQISPSREEGTPRFEELGFAKVDHERAQRQGFPEVIFCLGKTPAQVAPIARSLHERGSTLLATRADRATYDAVQLQVPTAQYNETARLIFAAGREKPHLPGNIAVLAAGTSDLPVAEEAVGTLEAMGADVQRIYDVGVAGLHRLLYFQDTLRACDVLIVCAGMEGALPSVVAGLVDIPVIAVPTSVGYGASFGGLGRVAGNAQLVRQWCGGSEHRQRVSAPQRSRLPCCARKSLLSNPDRVLDSSYGASKLRIACVILLWLSHISIVSPASRATWHLARCSIAACLSTNCAPV